MRRDPIFLRIDAKRKLIDNELAIGQDAIESHQATSSDPLRRHLLSSLGLAVHNIYNGIEAILEDVGQEIDGSKPNTAQYHRDLLFQLTQATESRGAMITEDNIDAIADILWFRHVLRHNYGGSLRAASVIEKFEKLKDRIVPDIYQQINDLEARLSEPSMFRVNLRSNDDPFDLGP